MAPSGEKATLVTSASCHSSMSSGVASITRQSHTLWSLLPRIYRWQMQRRVYRLYGELRLLETALGRCHDLDEREQVIGRIANLERRVFELRMPRSFSEMTLNLRRHIQTLHQSARASV